MPRVIQKCSGFPATSQHQCSCTGELRVHPVYLFTKLGTCPLTKSGVFPTPYLPNIPRVPSDIGTPDGKSSLFVFGRRHFTSVLAFDDPAFKCCISRYPVGIAFAGDTTTPSLPGFRKLQGARERWFTAVVNSKLTTALPTQAPLIKPLNCPRGIPAPTKKPQTQRA